MFKIPFALVPSSLLYKYSRSFYGFSEHITRKLPNLAINLTQAEARFTALEYTSMCLVADLLFFVFILLLAVIILLFLHGSLLIAPAFAVIITLFVFLQQIAYPKLRASRKIREVERNLISALQDIYIQLNSGIPLFTILVNISNGDYGEISKEFGAAVREINAGRPQIDALEDLAVRNPSLLFRRTLWQLVNGMKEGADISSLIAEVICSVGDVQMTQVQKYGGQLSPLALFYMLIAIIAPSLGVTFIIILSSFVSLSGSATKLVFYGLLVLTVFFQILFLGMIKTRRPSLL